MPGRLRALLLSVTLVALHDFAAAADWNVSALMNALSAHQSGTARFVETKHLAVLNAPTRQSGTLAYSPGYLERVTLVPNRERMVVNADSLTIDTYGRSRVRRLKLPRYPVLWGFVEGIRATLTGDQVTLERFFVAELHGTREDWELVLVPEQEKMRAVIRLISIRGGGHQIKVIELVEMGGDRSMIEVLENVP